VLDADAAPAEDCELACSPAAVPADAPSDVSPVCAELVADVPVAV